MLIDMLLEVKESIDKHGIRWGVIFALYAVYRKERRNMRLDQRDEAVFHNQRVIMEHLGVMDQWHGPVKISSWDRSNYKRLFSSLRKETQSGNQRRKKLMERLKSRKLWIAVVSAILLVLKEGLDIPVDSETVLAFAGIVITVILGLAHVDAKKAQGGNANEKPTDTIGSSK